MRTAMRWVWVNREPLMPAALSPTQKILLVGLGLCAFGALWRAEQEEDGTIVALSPFLAALALEAGIFMLRRHQSQLLMAPND